ncbi:MAG TPA: sulfotransferase, partial [Thermodesulfovibrionales bacterium]|nr:sulfotransferase [Thermodesulfovibrionales bacterium]
FLGIGANKAGTTWLYYQLAKHPDIWMPPLKELHYFDHLSRCSFPACSASDTTFRYLTRKDRLNRTRRKNFTRLLLSAILQRDWRRVHWTLRYFFGTRSDDWYVSLFQDGDGKVKGEITPCYSILDIKEVRHIRDMFPDLRIVLILRNPIERAWSQVRFNYGLRHFKGINSTPRIKKFLERPASVLRGDYTRIIQTWMSCFPKDQMFIGWFDDIVLNPKKFLFDVFTFLGVDPAAFPMNDRLGNKINMSPEKEMPKEIGRYLAAKYRPELRMLSALVGGYSDLWLNEAEKILKAAQ